MSKRKNPKWQAFKDQAVNKRTGKKDDCSSQREYITVQRLSSTVEGKWQKYSRIGPLTMVHLGCEATLENIKEACMKHFNITDMDCDVLAGERGPSYTEISQITNWKVLHIRFVGRNSSGNSRFTDRKMESPVKSQEAMRNFPPVTSSKIPASVPLSAMLKIGKFIPPRDDIFTLTLEEFDLKNKKWLPPVEVKVSLDDQPFSSGSFRDAYKATMVAGPLQSVGSKWVLKKFKKDEIPGIERLFESIEIHTRKMVQMNTLARNLAMQMAKEAPENFGETFSYNKVYFGKKKDEVVTLERFLEGDFQKHINNTGEIYGGRGNEVSLKSEAFVHYTYTATKEQLMVVDIQDVGFSLCDPEIASSTLIDSKDDSIFFCTGNLSTQAIERFINTHICNKYCQKLKLKDLQPGSQSA